MFRLEKDVNRVILCDYCTTISERISKYFRYTFELTYDSSRAVEFTNKPRRTGDLSRILPDHLRDFFALGSWKMEVRRCRREKHEGYEHSSYFLQHDEIRNRFLVRVLQGIPLLRTLNYNLAAE